MAVLPISLPWMRNLSESVFHGFLLVAIVALYWNSLQGAFIWDDRAAIIQNVDVRGISTISELFRHDFWGQDISLIDSHKSYRPFTILTFRLDHFFYGMNAYGYHLSNVLLYMATCILMYHSMLPWVDSVIARIATLLFVFHPIHVENVASIVGRADCLCGLFFFAAMITYAFGCRDSTGSIWSIGATVLAMLLGLSAALSKEIGITVFPVCIVLEVMEQMKPVILKNKHFRTIKLVDDPMVKAGYLSDNTLQNSVLIFAQTFRNIAQSIYSLLRIITIIFLVFMFFKFRGMLHGAHYTYTWTLMENHIDGLPSFSSRALSYGQSHFWYLFKLIFPRYLCFDYGFDCIPTIYGMADVRNVLPVLAYSLFLGTCYVAFARVRLSLMLGVVCFFLPLLPALNIVMPVGTILAERLLFVPSMGFCVVVAELLVLDGASLWAGLDDVVFGLYETFFLSTARPSSANPVVAMSWLLSPAPHGAAKSSSSYSSGGSNRTPASERKANKLRESLLQQEEEQYAASIKAQLPSSFYLFIVPLLAAFAVRVYTRNIDWRVEPNMYSSALAVCPRSLKVLSNHAMYESTQGRHQHAIALTSRAISIFPNSTAAMLNQGVAYSKVQNLVQSIQQYEAIVAIDDPLVINKARGYLGSTYYSFAAKVVESQIPNGKEIANRLREQALRWIDDSIAHYFAPPAILHVAGSTAFDLGKIDLAVKYYMGALEQHDRAVAHRGGSSDVPLEDDIHVPYTLNQLANCFVELNQHENALTVYAKGLEFEPNNIALLSNGGLLLRYVNRVDEARVYLQKALALSGERPPAALLNNLGSLELNEKRFDEAQEYFEQALRALRQRSTLNAGKVNHPEYRFDAEDGNNVEQVILQNLHKLAAERNRP